ncbi:MAG: methyltransferase domain-containing protein [Myxococcaceae bacterium]|nr:methyltransferase domain-containing protein [Myxococcaceae bacterium]
MYERFSRLSDADWHAVLKRSLKEPVIDGVRFPGFPDDSTQALFTSHKGDAALNEAFTFFQIAQAACSRFGKPLGRATRLLDFGVGWGRIVRYFLRDVAPQNIHGVDVTPQVLGICQSLLPVGDYRLVKPRGAFDYADASFDLVTAFSVFSHLSADNGLHWIREMHRVVAPGGLVVLTTLSRSFVALCRDVATNPGASDWAKGMAESVTRSYPDWKTKLAKFPEDELLYLSSGGGFDSLAPDDYGWAMVPAAWARKNWGPYFEVVEYADDPAKLAQAYMTLRRRP